MDGTTRASARDAAADLQPRQRSTSAGSASCSTCSTAPASPATGRAPGPGPAGRGLRVLPREVRPRRGQARRRVLHPAVGGAGARRGARAVPRAACTTRAAARAACSCRPRSSSRRTTATRRTSSIFGQELNERDLADGEDEPRDPRHLNGDLGPAGATPSPATCTPDVQADYVLANPPFNIKDWARNDEDARWRSASRPPATPTTPGSSTSSASSRRAARPASSWPTARCRPTPAARARSAPRSSRRTSSPAWSRCRPSCSAAPASRSACGSSRRTRPQGKQGSIDRTGQVLFIDARDLGYMVDRAERALSDEDIAKIADTFHAWRGTQSAQAKGVDVRGRPGLLQVA